MSSQHGILTLQVKAFESIENFSVWIMCKSARDLEGVVLPVLV